ncbi:MAG: hypothetical protein LBF88_09610 [Planctomycetaceae bacterium]|jgi:type II secretory pathway pseudopilin PulG|nr:hypothetical protein [Planctomycetaceae bacterium]
MKKLQKISFGYTLIELLIAATLSLLLLLGVTKMFQHVGSVMNDTQKSLNMSANLNAAAMTLRSDLSKIDPALARKPNDMVNGNTVTDDGYLEIIEGMNAPYNITNNNGLHVPITQVAFSPDVSGIDRTVGDMDDILAFTAEAGADYKFRGLINGSMNESSFAEIIWFVRGTTLYRRVLLYDENNTNVNKETLDQNQESFYARNDLSVYLDGTTIKAREIQASSRRENRFAHSNGTFPFPLYDNSNAAWYYLRMPTLEETVSPSWIPGQPLPVRGSSVNMNEKAIPDPPVPYWDFWENPNSLSGSDWHLDPQSGSIIDYVTVPRHSRAGEDIVQKNVISFDVKVWNPYWVPCYDVSSDSPGRSSSSVSWLWAPPQYVDLGQDQFYLQDPATQEWNWYPVNYLQDLDDTSISGGVIPPPPVGDRGYGFTLKGRYNTSMENRRILKDSDGTVIVDPHKWDKAERLNNGTADNRIWNGSPMPCVFDSWTKEGYEDNVGTPQSVVTGSVSDNYAANDPTTWRCPPPYTERLTSIQVTIRCFEPQSGHIKQIRVVRKF